MIKYFQIQQINRNGEANSSYQLYSGTCGVNIVVESLLNKSKLVGLCTVRETPIKTCALHITSQKNDETTRQHF